MDKDEFIKSLIDYIEECGQHKYSDFTKAYDLDRLITEYEIYYKNEIRDEIEESVRAQIEDDIEY